MYQLIIILNILLINNTMPQPSSWKVIRVSANLDDKEEIERLGLDFLINEKVAKMNLEIKINKDSLLFIENGKIQDALKIVFIKNEEILLKDRDEEFILKYSLKNEGKECVFFSEENQDSFYTRKIE